MKALTESMADLRTGIDHLLHERTELLAALTTYLPSALAEPVAGAPQGTPIAIRLQTPAGDVVYDVEPHHRGHFGHLPWLPHGAYELPRIGAPERSQRMHDAVRARAEETDATPLEDVAARLACLLAAHDDLESTTVTDPDRDRIVATTSTGSYEITVRAL